MASKIGVRIVYKRTPAQCRIRPRTCMGPRLSHSCVISCSSCSPGLGPGAYQVLRTASVALASCSLLLQCSASQPLLRAPRLFSRQARASIYPLTPITGYLDAALDKRFGRPTPSIPKRAHRHRRGPVSIPCETPRKKSPVSHGENESTLSLPMQG